MSHSTGWPAALMALAVTAAAAFSQTPPVSTSSSVQTAVTPGSSTITRLVMLGTGTPNADPERSGPAVAVVVNDSAYLVDCGTGVVRRAAAAAAARGVTALEPKRLTIGFLTHLHSDHTLGYADLVLTPWEPDIGQRHVPAL